MIKDRLSRATGSTNELISLCKETVFGKYQIENMLLLYRSVFLPRVIHNSEAWSILSPKDVADLRKVQLSYLCRVLEVLRSKPTAALYLETGILPIEYEMQIKQLLFLKHILDKDSTDPVAQMYNEMHKFQNEPNWVNNAFELRSRYNLPLNDMNVKSMTRNDWKIFVKNRVKACAFEKLLFQCSSNRKTNQLSYKRLEAQNYLTSLGSSEARIIFKVRVRMLDLKTNFKRKYELNLSCPFCLEGEESIDHIFTCNKGLLRPDKLENITFTEINKTDNMRLLKDVAKFINRYKKFRDILI